VSVNHGARARASRLCSVCRLPRIATTRFTGSTFAGGAATSRRVGACPDSLGALTHFGGEFDISLSVKSTLLRRPDLCFIERSGELQMRTILLVDDPRLQHTRQPSSTDARQENQPRSLLRTRRAAGEPGEVFLDGAQEQGSNLLKTSPALSRRAGPPRACPACTFGRRRGGGGVSAPRRPARLPRRGSRA